jgi:hypothetical protein
MVIATLWRLTIFAGIMSKVERINEAIRECLDGCYRAPMPLAHLAEYVARLRSDDSWHEADVLEVEVGVRQMLKGITGVGGDSLS